jgi:hypothetical protein
VLSTYMRKLGKSPYSREQLAEKALEFLSDMRTHRELKGLFDELASTDTRGGRTAIEAVRDALLAHANGIADERSRALQRRACIELAITSSLRRMILVNAQKQRHFSTWLHLVESDKRLQFLGSVDEVERSRSVLLVYLEQVLCCSWLTDLYVQLFAANGDGPEFEAWLSALQECYREYFAVDMRWGDLTADLAEAGQRDLALSFAQIRDDEVNPILNLAAAKFQFAQARAREGDFQGFALEGGLREIRKGLEAVQIRHPEILDQLA